MKLPANHWLTRARRTMLPGELEKSEWREIWVILSVTAAIVFVYDVLKDRIDVQFVLALLSRKN